jgi:hypothetical protein
MWDFLHKHEHIEALVREGGPPLISEDVFAQSQMMIAE